MTCDINILISWQHYYQDGSPSRFYTLRHPSNSIEGPVSVTHGHSPRKHIWSFTNTLQEAYGFYDDRHIFPCRPRSNQSISYSAKFSWVFNFANFASFANFQLFAKLFQQNLQNLDPRKFSAIRYAQTTMFFQGIVS